MWVDQLVPGQPASGKPPIVPGGDITGDGVMVAAGQLGGIPQASGQIERFEYLHDLLGRLQKVPSSGLGREHPQ